MFFTQGTFVRKAEVIFSANYFGFDDVVTSDGERISDRISAIPFQDLPDISPAEFASRQKKFKTVIDSEEMPVEFLIGEMGDFVLSDEFLAKRTEFADLLLEKCEELIYIRTLMTNYASFYTLTWKLFSTFENVLREQGYTWDGMMHWMETVHAPFLIKQHQQSENPGISIRRYINALLNFTLDWSILQRRKLMKLMETSKIKEGEKYCLAFHASHSYRDLQEMGGVRLKDLKDHANAVGGCWGNDSWAVLVRDDVDIDFDTTNDEAGGAGLENTQSKRAILIPVSVFSSTQIIRICDLLGQNDDYKRFGADEETPSGVEKFSGYRNSTQIPGSQGLRLHVSNIEQVEDEELVEFDNLTSTEETEFQDESANEEPDLVNDHDHSEDVISCMECSAEFYTRRELSTHFRNSHSVKDGPSTKSTDKSKSITEVSINSRNYFVCNCGFSSLQKSASTRHKCRSGDSVLFHCLECNKPCKNPGSLKRHVDSKHKNKETLQASSIELESTNSSSMDLTNIATNNSMNGSRKSCNICKKTLLNDSNLKKHMHRVHSDVEGIFQEAEVAVNTSCEICKKTLLNESNLKKHMERVHSVIKEFNSSQPLSESRIRSLLTKTADESATILTETGILEETPGFSCNICSKTLKSKLNLENHLSKVHKKDGTDKVVGKDAEVSKARRPSTRSSQPTERRRSVSLLRHKGKRKY